MNKFKFYIFLLVLFSNQMEYSLMFGQNLSVVYEKVTIPDYDDDDDLTVTQVAQPVSRYSLTVYEGRSVFTLDSAINYVEYPPFTNTYMFKKSIYKEYSTGVWLEESSRYKPGHVLSEDLFESWNKNKKLWKLTDSTKIILGYKCIKSMNGEFNAWHTTEISIMDGPFYGTFGLPGLVLELNAHSDSWTAIQILPVEREVILPQDKIKSTTKESISLPVFNAKNMPSKDVIKINSKTPLNKWIKFE